MLTGVIAELPMCYMFFWRPETALGSFITLKQFGAARTEVIEIHKPMIIDITFFTFVDTAVGIIIQGIENFRIVIGTSLSC